MKRLWSKQNWDAKHFRRLRIFATVRNLILFIFFILIFFERNHFFFIKDKKKCTVLVCLLLVKWLRTLRYSVVANFCNCCENSGLRNFATSEILQVVKFRNLRNLRRLRNFWALSWTSHCSKNLTKAVKNKHIKN